MAYDEDEDPEFEEGQDDAALDGEAEAHCPYCGEVVSISVDQGGGLEQEYVEDCPVCCKPWKVHVHIRRNGGAEVYLEELG